MQHNQMCVVSDAAIFHKGRIGFFQFYGGPKNDVAVFTTEKKVSVVNRYEYFAVDRDHIKAV